MGCDENCGQCKKTRPSGVHATLASHVSLTDTIKMNHVYQN